MRITDYPAITPSQEASPDACFVVDSSSGTKKLNLADAGYILFDKTPEMHRVIWRGKNLGSRFTTEQIRGIQNGTFRDVWLGDYLVGTNGVKYRVVDFDYWYGTEVINASNVHNRHHVVLMPDTILPGQSTTWSTTQHRVPYNGSHVHTRVKMNGSYDSATSSALNGIGLSILNIPFHKSNQVVNNVVTGGQNYVDRCVVPTAAMLFGHQVFLPYPTTTSTNRYDQFADQKQLAAFAVNPTFMLTSPKASWWVDEVGYLGNRLAVDQYGKNKFFGNNTGAGIRVAVAVG